MGQAKGRIRQRGVAVLLLVVTLLLGAAAVFYGLTTATSPDVERDRKTTEALALAKQSLISYATGNSNRPGELPCPDITNDGHADEPCDLVSTQIGRLPWYDLGIAELRDGSGERLWYVVSSNYKKNSPVSPLNSNTPGQLTVTGIAPASNVIAIVFSPGAVMTGQSRTPVNENNIVHYLEDENANGDTTFSTAAQGSTFNDRLLAITSAMLVPQLELRVAREARNFLNQYFGINGFYPVAYAYGGTGLCESSNQGRVHSDPSQCGGGQQNWSGAFVPSWFWTNLWNQVLFYAVAPACNDPGATSCSGSGGLLMVNSVGNVRAIVIAPGAAYLGQSRNSPATASITDYLEAPNTTSYPIFSHVTNSTTINDRVVIIAPPPP